MNLPVTPDTDNGFVQAVGRTATESSARVRTVFQFFDIVLLFV